MLKLRHCTSDTLFALGSSQPPYHRHAEIFSILTSKWQVKEDYPNKMDHLINPTNDICHFSILAVDKKIIIFGGFCHTW